MYYVDTQDLPQLWRLYRIKTCIPLLKMSIENVYDDKPTTSKVMCSCGLELRNQRCYKNHLNTEKHQRHLAFINQKVFTILTHYKKNIIQVTYWIDNKRCKKCWYTIGEMSPDEYEIMAIEFMREISKDPDFIFCPHNRNKTFCPKCIKLVASCIG